MRLKGGDFWQKHIGRPHPYHGEPWIRPFCWYGFHIQDLIFGAKTIGSVSWPSPTESQFVNPVALPERYHWRI